mgnify:FL=1|tara:strand:+ start:550 stop:846 length:297 start_codon:yes stop_codon:yes gene_type:complete
MAITKEETLDKIECVGKHRTIQLRYRTVIKEDDKIISNNFRRRAFDSGRIDGSDNWIDTDISGETAEVQAICNASWTDEVKAAYKKHLIDTKNLGQSV